MEKKEEKKENSIFEESSDEEKIIDRKNIMENKLSDINDIKRNRDENAENFRKKQRDKKFKAKRMFEDELPELDIPEINSKIPATITELKQNIQPEPSKPAEPVISLSDAPFILQEFNSNDPEICLSGLKKFRRLLSASGSTPIQEVLDLGILPRLCELLKCSDKPILQLEATWCITNIALGTEDHIMAIVKKNGIELLKGVLDSVHRNNQEQAIWALGNIAGENHHFRDAVLKSDVIKKIAKISKNTHIYSLQKNCMWCLANLCRGKPHPSPKLVAPVFFLILLCFRLLKLHVLLLGNKMT